jgi:hypothetical protein
MHRRISYVAGALLLLSMMPARATAAVTCGETWSVSERGAFHAYWWHVAVGDESHVWVTGTTVDDYPIVAFWDGTTWTDATPPQFAGTSSSLRAAWSTGPSDVWLRGNYFDDVTQMSLPLIMHWNGSSWVQEATPDSKSARLMALWGSDSGDLWAAGVGHTGGRYVGLVLHRVGTTWESVKVPRKIDHERWLYDISGSSSTDIWAAGYDYDKVAKVSVPLMMHWNGVSFDRVPTPKVPVSSNTSFSGVAAVDDSNAWAVGYLLDSEQALLERWDGASWHIVPLSDHTGYEGIQGVDATSTTNAYAVGYRDGHPTIRQWDGIAWSSVNPPWSNGTGIDVTATATDGTWIVGSGSNGEIVASTCS